MKHDSMVKRFKEHIKSGGFFYAIVRGVKYYFFLKTQWKNFIKKDRLTLIYENQSIKIFWDNYEITSNVGLNVGINTLGVWTDSTKAQWQLKERGKDYFRFRVVFSDLPLAQEWEIAVHDGYQIHWKVSTEIEKWLHIDELRILALIHPRYKSWFHNYNLVDFIRFRNQWMDISMTASPTFIVGARFFTEGKFLPAISIEPDGNHERFLSVVQNAPLESNAHIVGVSKSIAEEEKECVPARYSTFSGIITVYAEEKVLDEKIERLRQRHIAAAKDGTQETIKKKRRTKILLANLPWQKHGMTGVRAGSRWPHIKDESEGNYFPFPFFLAYATALLRKNNIAADIIDAATQEMSEENFLSELLNIDFDLLVVETSVPSFHHDITLLQKLSSRGARIVLCGPHCEIYAPDFLKTHNYIDCVLFGEYEFTLLALAQALAEGRQDLSSVDGLIWRDSRNNIVKNKPRAPFDINLLPWPQRDGLPMERYWDLPGNIPRPSVQMVASRGCPFSCNFCLWPQILFGGATYRARAVKDVIDEMEFLVREKGFKSVYFDDDTFNVGKPRMLQFCNEIIRRDLHQIPWAVMAKADLMDEEILEHMKKAGLWAVKYGVESASQTLLNTCGKGLALEKALRMIKHTQALGIKTHLTFSFGLCGETKETIKQSTDLVLSLNPESVQFSIITPFPGTRLFDLLDKEGRILSKDWSLYDGHHSCVYRPENLTPSELEEAKARAYQLWGEHLRRKQRLLTDIHGQRVTY